MTFSDITTPTWKQIGEMQNEIDMLNAENALKLTQILDLEITLYNTRKIEFDDNGAPCWCHGYVDGDDHTDNCKAARKATESFWKK